MCALRRSLAPLADVENEVQILLVEEGEVEGDAAAFYAALGINDPSSFKPQAPQETAHDVPAKVWAVQYMLIDSGDEFGFPLQQKGGNPREHSADNLRKVLATAKPLALLSIFFCVQT
jgi:hypothetical protein